MTSKYALPEPPYTGSCAPPATSRSSWSWRSASPSCRTGGNFADAVFTALTMGFLAGIAWMLYVLSRQNQLTLATSATAGGRSSTAPSG